MQKIDDVLPQVDLLVLTSISEGLPLVIIEAFSAGVPVVASDVGACRELIEGKDAEDQALGKAGVVTQIANPEATAQGCLSLLQNSTIWQQAQHTALKRVEKYYDKTNIWQQYQHLYTEMMEQ